MAKKTNSKAKAVKTNSKTTWFNTRNYGKSSITATRSPKVAVEVKNDSNPEVKPLKNMEVVRMVLESGGRMDLESAIEKFLEVHTLATDNPKPRARRIFLEANKYVKALGHPAGVKIEKVDKNTYIQLA